MKTFEDVKAKADEVELAAIMFLDANGKVARNHHSVTQVELTFVDGETILIPKSETERQEFNDYQFKLRKSRDDA